MKNKLTDLNEHLYAQMERLSNTSLSESELKKEILRAQAITAVSKERVTPAMSIKNISLFAILLLLVLPIITLYRWTFHSRRYLARIKKEHLTRRNPNG